MTQMRDRRQGERGVSFREAVFSQVAYLWTWVKLVAVGVLMLFAPIVVLAAAEEPLVDAGVSTSAVNGLMLLWFLACIFLLPAYKRAKLSQI